MAGPAVHAGAAVAGVGGQQVFQQAGAQPGHRRTDRQLGRLQAAAGTQRTCRHRGQPPYLGRGLRRERLAEPPLSPAGPAGDCSAGGVTGRAWQIASFTATICSDSAANCR